MALRLVIDNPVTFSEESLDLFPGTEFWISKQIHDLKDLTTRNADFTKSISVPATAKNVLLLRVEDLFDVAEAQPVIAVECDIILDGIPIANNAKLYVDSVEDGELKIAILFGNFHFFDQIQGNIREIDLAADAFTYDLATITGTQVRYTLVSWVGTTITFQAAEPVVPLVAGDWLVMEQPGNGRFSTQQVVSVTSAQVYVIDISASGVAPYYVTVQDGNTDGLAQKTSGVVYPFADWFNILEYAPLTTTSAFRYKQDIAMSGFFYYCHSLFEKIVNDAGFTLDRTAIDNPLYNEIALACPLPIFVLQASDSSIVQQEKASQQILSGIGGVDDIQRIEFDNPIAIDNALAVWNFGTDAFDWIAAPSNIFVEVVLGNFALNIQGNGFFVTINLHHNGAILDTIQYDRLSVNTNAALSGQATAIPTDEFYLEIIADGGAGGNGGAITLEIAPITSTIQLGRGGSSASRDINNPSIWLPELTKRDFLLGILSMQNIVMQTNDLEKTVTLEYFDGIGHNPEQSLVIDTSRPEKKSTLIGSYFRNSKMQYKEESGIFRTDTSIILTIEDERLALNGTVIELPFAACDQSSLYFARDEIPPPIANVISYEFELDSTSGLSWNIDSQSIFFEAGTAVKVGDYVGAELGGHQEFRRVVSVLTPTTAEISGTWSRVSQVIEETSTIIRMNEAANLGKIVQITPMQKAFNLSDGFIFNSNTGGQAPSPDPQNVDHVGVFVLNGFDTGFSTPMLWSSLSPTYYAELFNALNKPLVLQLEVYLTVAEFKALDFLRPVYLGSPYNAEFYINLISQFKAGSPVRLDLFRISIT